MIDPFAFKIWWCCLNPVERNISTALILIYSSLAGFVTVSEYEALWAASGVGSPLKRGEAYRASYWLEPGVWDPSGEDPIDVYYFDLVFWLEFSVFFFSPDSSCAGGCKILDFT